MVSTNVLNKVNKAIVDNFDSHLADLVPKAADTAAKVDSLAGIAANDLGGIQETFCTAWPKVYPMLNLGLKFLGWVAPPAAVALARTVLNAINTEVYPVLCPKKV